MNAEQVPVLIVGAGGGGLTLALLLIQQGVHPLIVERRPTVSWYPRARNLNFRTLEVFRGLGLSKALQAAGAHVSRVFARDHLASSRQKEVLDPASLLQTEQLSPEPSWLYCPQSRLEPILLQAAKARGADVRYSTELVGVVPDNQGVTATLQGASTGESQVVRARYLVGADGAHSSVRERAHIPTQGPGALDEHYVFIYFRASWDEFIRGQETDAFLIDNADVRGIFVVAEQHLGMFVLTLERGADAPNGDRARELVEKAIGQPGVAVEVIEVASWRPEERVAAASSRDACSWSAMPPTRCRRKKGSASTPPFRARRTWRGSWRPS
jgi:putative polyketide hydroxylase